ncbi:hypothetical protein LTR54_018402, partial [Friedmanniomyces endolithicus]
PAADTAAESDSEKFLHNIVNDDVTKFGDDCFWKNSGCLTGRSILRRLTGRGTRIVLEATSYLPKAHIVDPLSTSAEPLGPLGQKIALHVHKQTNPKSRQPGGTLPVGRV